MIQQLGDFRANSIIDFKWNTFGDFGQSITRSTNGNIRIYKNNSATQRTSVAGITDTEDFDGLTGLHHLRIDLSNNTDAGFYSTITPFQVVVEGMVVDGETMNVVIAHFSIEMIIHNANVTQWLGTAPNVLIANRVDTSVGAMAADVLTNTAIAVDAIGASELAADAVAEIQSGLATAAALATVQAGTDDLQTKVNAMFAKLPSKSFLTGSNNSDGDIEMNESTGGFNATQKTDINAEVVDTLAVDTYAEPAATPAATSSIKDKIGFVFKAVRNKNKSNAGSHVIRNDADSADDNTAVLSYVAG